MSKLNLSFASRGLDVRCCLMTRSSLAALALIACLASCAADEGGAVSDTGGDALAEIAADSADAADSPVADLPPDSADSDVLADAPVDTSPDLPPGEQPLLTVDDFEYVGAFRFPDDDFGDSSLNYSEGPFAYHPGRQSVFIVGHNHQQALAEFNVPELAAGTALGELTFAESPVQAFVGILGRTGANPQELNTIGGLAFLEGPDGPQLVVNAYEYYDAPADNTQTTLVIRSPNDLAGSTVDGFFAFEGAAHAAGWISPIPSEWQADLGGAYLTGASSGIPIIGRASVGPSAFVFEPNDLVGDNATPGPVATTALLDFSLAHPLHDDLSNNGGDNDVWTHLSRAVYGFIAPGTRTYVTLGYSGGHQSGVCYKCTPVNGSQECGGYCSNDATDYAQYYWLWDLADLLAVRAGETEPWDVQPYDYGVFDTPFATDALGGGSFDPESGLLYLTLQRADRAQGDYSNPPVLLALRARQ